MESKEEIVKMYKSKLFNTLKGFDTKENVEKFINGIGDDAIYEVVLLYMNGSRQRTLEQAIARDCTYYYMMYPDY